MSESYVQRCQPSHITMDGDWDWECVLQVAVEHTLCVYEKSHLDPLVDGFMGIIT